MAYTVNGETIDGIPAPILGDGTTFVPLAFVAQSLGGYANFEHESKVAHIDLGDNKIAVQAGNATVDVSGQSLTLQAEPFIQDDQMWVPVRLFESLGYSLNVSGSDISLSGTS